MALSSTPMIFLVKDFAHFIAKLFYWKKGTSEEMVEHLLFDTQNNLLRGFLGVSERSTYPGTETAERKLRKALKRRLIARYIFTCFVPGLFQLLRGKSNYRAWAQKKGEDWISRVTLKMFIEENPTPTDMPVMLFR